MLDDNNKKMVAVTVAPDGTTKVEFSGFAGASCLAADKELQAALAALGIEVEETAFSAKPELLAAQAQAQAHWQLGLNWNGESDTTSRQPMQTQLLPAKAKE